MNACEITITRAFDFDEQHVRLVMLDDTRDGRSHPDQRVSADGAGCVCPSTPRESKHAIRAT